MSIPDATPTIAHSVADMLARQIPCVAYVGPTMSLIDVTLAEPTNQLGGEPPVLVIGIRPCDFARTERLRIEAHLTIRSVVIDDPPAAVAIANGEVPASDQPPPRR